MVKIEESMRSLIVEHMTAGLSQRYLSRLLGISQSSINYVWKRYLETGSLENRQKSGRPRKTTERDRRKICNTSKKNPFLTAKEVYDEAGELPKMSMCSV